MEILVGCAGTPGSEDAVALGAGLARSLGATVVLAHVRPAAWAPVGAGRVDAEWDAYVEQQTQALLADAARSESLSGLTVTSVVGRHRSSGTGLAQLAEERGSELIVIGSAGDTVGRITNGSTSDQLMHGSSVPVAVAPAAFRTHPPGRLRRLVVAFQGTAESRGALGLAFRVAGAVPVPIHLVSVVERTTRIYGSRLGDSAEAGVLAGLRSWFEDAQHEALGKTPAGIRTSSAVVSGDSVGAALAQVAWQDGDLLVVGSSRQGPLARVFLGDMTFKLLRASPVPALVAVHDG